MSEFAVKQKQKVLTRAKPSTAFSPASPNHQQTQIQNILRSTGAQAKLTIGQPGDKYEQEADRVADQVMRMSDADVAQRVETGTVQPMQIQRMCSECEKDVQRQHEEEEQLQAKESPGQTPQVTPNLESRINSLKGGGQPLDPATRSFFEPRFGHDFSKVRVHSDSSSADTAKSINARAFTLGNHVVMGSGEYQPKSQSGQRLLGHELTHIVQQGGAQGSNAMIQKEEPVTTDALSGESFDNNVESLQFANIEELLKVYVTLQDSVSIYLSEPHRQVTYTYEWVIGVGNLILEQEISSRLSSMSVAQLREVYVIIYGLREEGYLLPDLKRQNWLGDQIEFHISQLSESSKESEESNKVEYESFSADEILSLKTIITGLIAITASQMGEASKRVAASVKSLAKSEADTFALLLDLGMVFLTPILVGKLASLANNIPVSSPKVIYVAAIKALDTSFTKSVLSASTKAGKEILKKNATVLFGETEIDTFIIGLRGSYTKSFKEIIKTLPNDPIELGLIYLAFDNVDEEFFVSNFQAEIYNFQKYVQPIGTTSSPPIGSPSYNYQKKLYWVEMPSDSPPKLGLIKESPWHALCHYLWVEWVPNEYKDLAIAKHNETFGEEVKILPFDSVDWRPNEHNPKKVRCANY